MYRILSAAGHNGERRRQATHPARAIPELVATGPSQVFTWDITKLPGPDKGIWYHAYVIIDIFSRYIVGHTVERAETAERAEELIRATVERNGIVPETVHADRGTSMTSKKVSQLLIDLGIARSHSRPRVSNDNPYSESQFRTTKYAADYPERFDSLTHAREWMDAFITYYNHEHRHSGIGLHTPASIHFGTAKEVRDQRAAALAEAYERHPERFARRPKPPRYPATSGSTTQRNVGNPNHKAHSTANVSFDLTTTGPSRRFENRGCCHTPHRPASSAGMMEGRALRAWCAGAQVGQDVCRAGAATLVVAAPAPVGGGVWPSLRWGACGALTSCLHEGCRPRCDQKQEEWLLHCNDRACRRS
ncbi:DDE-type integrase/transposase/recombinase [Streptomyces halobius]|uniref:DDE-type integrase/transposase/recombinase n=1 Tax=Streptomyces halobius TaxID=2879846 RepID=A0ABY4M8I3_9ACTN|nr:DDE-type integrase/transposase/recombinase [Streptomyces halobius]UQA92576.1 DDE-type integrase/transposase/recombinase [Streptomyces halobius]